MANYRCLVKNISTFRQFNILPYSSAYFINAYQLSRPPLNHHLPNFCATLVTKCTTTSNNICDTTSFRTFSTDNNSKSDKNVKSIDEFRAREEQRESECEQINESDEKNTSSQNNESAKMKKIRNDILDAALLFVGVHGWSRDAIANGAEQIGYPGIVHGMFPNGGIELINHFYMQCNERLMTQLNEELKLKSNDDKNESQKQVDSPLDMLKKALRIRLQMNEPYLSNWHQALAVMALPPNVPTSLAQLLTLVDDICYYAGDRSVDFSWYTRRIGLAAIYKMTEVFMIADKSTGHEETWKFLDRRLEEGHQLLEALQLTDATTKNMTRAVNSAFLTARNIIGLNFNRR